MKNIFKAVGMAVIAFTVFGCNSDNITIEDNAQHEEYVRNFIKSFGVPDPDHNYAMAKAAGLHVTTKKGGHVTVTAEVHGKEYLFADLDVPAGTHALPVTIPGSVKELIVKYDRGVQTVATDATVDLDKAPAGSRITAKDSNYPVLYGGEYNIYDPSIDAEMELRPVDNDPPYLYLGFGNNTVTKKFFIENVLASMGKENTSNSFTLTNPNESNGEVLRFDPNNPAPHETILTCSGGNTSYYIFPVFWKKDRNGSKDYEIVFHKACDGSNELKSPYIVSFADAADDKSKTPFPHLGSSTSNVNQYYVYPYGDHVYTAGTAANYPVNWDLIKFGGNDDMAYDRSTATMMISRGIRINMSSTKEYKPGVAIAVRSNFADGKPGSFVSSAPFYNTHPDAWGENYYDSPLHNLYLAAAATLRWNVGGSFNIDPYIMDKKIDTKDKSHPEAGESGSRPDSIPMSIKNSGVWGINNQWGKLRTDQPFLLGFSSQPTTPASNDMRDYCDVILLVTPHHKTIKWGDGYIGVWYRHLFAQKPEPMVWTLAAEDLGGSDDWDFNDVVFTFTDVIRNLKSTNWLSSQAMISGPNGAGSVRTINIKPVATGGTMPIYITLTAKGILSPDQIPEMASDGETMFSVANEAIKEAIGLSSGGDDVGDTYTYILGT